MESRKRSAQAEAALGQMRLDMGALRLLRGIVRPAAGYGQPDKGLVRAGHDPDAGSAFLQACIAQRSADEARDELFEKGASPETAAVAPPRLSSNESPGWRV